MYRFADHTFDPRSGDLSSPGGTARLQPRTAALLTVLIEHAGAVVTRTELQQRLWPDTTVEFDDGLNTCVRQLRVALQDEASAPRYIETLPKRGYRFLPKVETALPAPAVPTPSRRKWIAISMVGAAMAVFVLALGMIGRSSKSSQLSLSIVPFTVDTTDRLMVSYQSRLMSQMIENATAERGWQLVGGNGATFVVSGSLMRVGNTVRIFAQLVRTRDGRHLWAEDIVDTYPFAGNSAVMGDRIEKTVARVLGSVTQ
jgi:DNA-binding winged helix-turn-helix (wHTH) protein